VRHFVPAAPRERAAVSRCFFWVLSLRRRSLAPGLLNAQRYQTNDSRWCAHQHLKVVGGATAGNEMLTIAYSGFLSDRLGLPFPHPRFPLRSTCLSDGSATVGNEKLYILCVHLRIYRRNDCCTHCRRRAGEVFYRSNPPPLRCARLHLRWARCRVTNANILSASLADGWMAASNLSRWCTNEMAVGVLACDTYVTLTDGQACLYSQPHYISATISRMTTPPRPRPLLLNFLLVCCMKQLKTSSRGLGWRFRKKI
jgi:hypothetical protein